MLPHYETLDSQGKLVVRKNQWTSVGLDLDHLWAQRDPQTEPGHLLHNSHFLFFGYSKQTTVPEHSWNYQ